MVSDDSRVVFFLKSISFGFMASSVDGVPHVRPLAFVWKDGMFWSSTMADSGKVAELEANDQVELAFVGRELEQLRVSGRIILSRDASDRDTLMRLNPHVRSFFSGSEDDNFIVLKIDPKSIRFKSYGVSEYEEVLL